MNLMEVSLQKKGLSLSLNRFEIREQTLCKEKIKTFLKENKLEEDKVNVKQSKANNIFDIAKNFFILNNSCSFLYFNFSDSSSFYFEELPGLLLTL